MLQEESTRRLTNFATKCASEAGLGRLVLLDRTRYDITSTTTILGCTLWSHLDVAHLDDVRASVKDFRMIEGFTTDVYQELHRRDVEWLQRTLAEIRRDELQRKVIVMTHHAPTVEGTSKPTYSGSAISSAFSTELLGHPDWDMAQVKMWLSGHTHWPCDFMRKGVRVVSNPRGYRNAGEMGFDPTKVVEVE